MLSLAPHGLCLSKCIICLGVLLSKIKSLPVTSLSPFIVLGHHATSIWVQCHPCAPHSHWHCLPLQDDVWGYRWSVPRLALPLMPSDSSHEEEVGKGQTRHRRGHPKGHGVGGFVDFLPVSVPFDLQSSPPGTA
jgi:hypothetical protein